MAYYLSKYIGTYRLKADIDLNTNDYPRDPESKHIEQNDVYIKCANGGKIYHYGHSTLVCYVPSLGRGRNILKKIATEIGINVNDYMKNNLFDYNLFYKELNKNKTVFNIEETDSEVLWKFTDRNMKLMASAMQAQTTGANISPFSPKNLPKDKSYVIPPHEIEVYREITDAIPKENKLTIGRFTSNYISEIIPKKHKEYTKEDMKSLMKLKRLKGKEFIHSLGLWDDYIEYLRKESDENIVKNN